jgi:hypothetical protein
MIKGSTEGDFVVVNGDLRTLTFVECKNYYDAANWAWAAARHLEPDENAALASARQDSYAVLLHDVSQSAQALSDSSVRVLVRRFWSPWGRSPGTRSAPQRNVAEARFARQRSVAEALLWYQLEAANSEPERRRILQTIALATIRAIHSGIDPRAVFALLHHHSGSKPTSKHHGGCRERPRDELYELAHSIIPNAPPVLAGAEPRRGGGAFSVTRYDRLNFHTCLSRSARRWSSFRPGDTYGRRHHLPKIRNGQIDSGRAWPVPAQEVVALVTAPRSKTSASRLGEFRRRVRVETRVRGSAREDRRFQDGSPRAQADSWRHSRPAAPFPRRLARRDLLRGAWAHKDYASDQTRRHQCSRSHDRFVGVPS